MERRYDFVRRLDPDVSLKILTRLDDPKDVAKLELVSTVWRKFVVAYGLKKKLCLKLCPEISKIKHVELTRMPKKLRARIAEYSAYLEREHRVFSFLSCGLVEFPPNYRIDYLLCSSPGEFWDEESSAKEGGRYFLSKGTSDPTIPVTMMYVMSSKLGIISEISLKPSRGWGPEQPIFSAETVRFSLGYERANLLITDHIKGAPVREEDFIWTYTSPEFPMAQENVLQQFQLDKPVLCLGGILRIELLGRINKHHRDDLYHIWLDDVQVCGRSLEPVFDVDIRYRGECCTLICDYHVALEFCRRWRPVHPRRPIYARLGLPA